MKILSAEHWAPVFKYQGVNEIKYIQFIIRNCVVIDFLSEIVSGPKTSG